MPDPPAAVAMEQPIDGVRLAVTSVLHHTVLERSALAEIVALAGEIVSVDLELSFEDGLRLLLRGISPAKVT